MRDKSYLGTFELMVLLAVMRVGAKAYGVSISRDIEDKIGRTVALASVYAALDRLGEKGLVTSELGESTAERGGRAKRYFRVTVAGLREVRDTQRSLTKLWQRLPALKGEPA
jgi:PadR family transcriptional regulator PadR